MLGKPPVQPLNLQTHCVAAAQLLHQRATQMYMKEPRLITAAPSALHSETDSLHHHAASSPLGYCPVSCPAGKYASCIVPRLCAATTARSFHGLCSSSVLFSTRVSTMTPSSAAGAPIVHHCTTIPLPAATQPCDSARVMLCLTRGAIMRVSSRHCSATHVPSCCIAELLHASRNDCYATDW